MPKRYFIKDLEKILGVRRTVIFYWESRKKIPKARRTPMGNYRWWTENDLEKIREIVRGGK
jgi:DNA-binding transcriptional MerR regulator